MEPFSSCVMLIMAISKAFELELVTGLGYHEFARPSQGDMALRNDSILSPEDRSSAVHQWPFQFVLSIGIQDIQLPLLSEWRSLHALVHLCLPFLYLWPGL